MVYKITLKTREKVREIIPSVVLTPTLNQQNSCGQHRGTKPKPVQHSLVFRDYNKSQTCSTAVLIRSQYMRQSAHIFIFFLCYLWHQEPLFSWKISPCGRKLFNTASTKNAQIILYAIFAIMGAMPPEITRGEEIKNKMQKRPTLVCNSVLLPILQ